MSMVLDSIINSIPALQRLQTKRIANAKAGEGSVSVILVSLRITNNYNIYLNESHKYGK